MLGNTLRGKMKHGWAFGTFLIELPCPATVTAMALAGFDFVVLDMEHSTVDFSSLETLVIAGRAAGLATLVRTWGQDRGLIGKALDMGASGIMAPHVDTAERAQAIVDQARFAPYGNRGFCPITTYDSLQEPLEALGAATFVAVQIEGKSALENVSEIAEVPGLDCVFVGPYDLALSMGVAPGSEEVFSAAAEIANSVPNDVGMGIYIDDPGKCSDWASRGFALQCVGYDGRMLSNGARDVVQQAKAEMTRQAGICE